MNIIYFPDTSKISASALKSWRYNWPNFEPWELDSNLTRELKVAEHAMDGIQAVRRAYGRPLYVSSCYRTPEHNKAVGGVTRSQHLISTAFDLPIKDRRMGDRIEAIARTHGARGIGRYNTFIHVDWREGRASSW